MQSKFKLWFGSIELPGWNFKMNLILDKVASTPLTQHTRVNDAVIWPQSKILDHKTKIAWNMDYNYYLHTKMLAWYMFWMIQQHWKVESSFAEEHLLNQNGHVTDSLEYQKPEKDWSFTLVILNSFLT